MTVGPPPLRRSRAQHLLDLAIPFLGVGAGVVTVMLVHNPMALIPRPPYWPWLLAASAPAALALVLAVGLEDAWEEADEVDPAERWRAAVLAYVAGVVASVTFFLSVALIDLLDAVI
jgi:amino acid transporter